MGQMWLTRDINQAWEQTKRTAAKRYPERFDLNDKKTLTWHSEAVARSRGAEHSAKAGA